MSLSALSQSGEGFFYVYLAGIRLPRVDRQASHYGAPSGLKPFRPGVAIHRMIGLTLKVSLRRETAGDLKAGD